MYSREINGPMPKSQVHFAASLRLFDGLAWMAYAGFGDSPYLINSPALLRLIRSAGIENHAVARLELAFYSRRDGIIEHPANLAQIYTALFSESAMHELLIVYPLEPPAVNSPRKRHLQFVMIARRWLITLPFCRIWMAGDLVQRLAINSRDIRDVFRGLQPAFNFQRRNSAAHDVGQDIESGEILRAQ